MDSSSSIPRVHPCIPKKEPQLATSPPPAYSPNRRLDLQAFMSRARQRSRSSSGQDSCGGIIAMDHRPLSTVVLGDSAVDDDEPEGLSAISLRINTSISVSKNDNLVSLSETPAEHANAVAQAVVQAIQRNSSGQCGIPMIDEDGRPRPLRIEVDAGIVVEGAGNVIGSEDVINEVLRQGRHRRRHRDGAEDEGELSGAAAKRRCSTRE